MKKIIDFQNIPLLIISLFPILFITGPFLTDLFCVILSFIFLFYLIKKKIWYILLENKFFYFFLLFYIYLNINSFFSFDSSISFIKSLPFIRIILFIFALSFFLNQNKKIYKIFYIIFIISILSLSFDSIIQFLFKFNLFRYEISIQSRISSFFGDEQIMGSYVSRLLPVALSISFLFKNKKKYQINLLIIILSGFLVLLSGERLATFYYVCIVILYFLLTKKHVLKFIVLLSIILILNIFYNPIYLQRIFNYTIDQFNQTNSVFSYRHTLHFKTAFDMFMDNKIKGHGLKSFRYLCSNTRYENRIKEKQNIDLLNSHSSKKIYILEYNNGCNTHPHNIYLEFLSELGIVGFIFLISAFIYTFFNLSYFLIRNIFKKFSDEKEVSKSLILSGIFLQLLPILPSGSFFNNWMLIIFHLSVGFYFAILKN